MKLYDPETDRILGLRVMAFIGLIVGLIWIGLGAFLWVPKALKIETIPSGASVSMGDAFGIGRKNVICLETPCTVKLNRIRPRLIRIELKDYQPSLFHLKSMGKDWDKTFSNKISMRPMPSLLTADTKKEREACLAAAANGKTISGETLANDTDAAPCLRIPPRMPSLANHSGHCHVRFDIDRFGITENVKATGCTDGIFARPSERAVEQWAYYPKRVAGFSVPRLGVESKMSFKLTDERGDVIPEPEIYATDDHTHVALDIMEANKADK